MMNSGPYVLERLATITLGCYLIGSGVLHLAPGREYYTNLLHRPVLSAAAVVLGAVLLAVGVLWGDLRERRR